MSFWGRGFESRLEFSSTEYAIKGTMESWPVLLALKNLCAQMQNWDWSRDCFWLAHFSFHFDRKRPYQHHCIATAEPSWALQTLCLASWVYHLGTFQDSGTHETYFAHFCLKIAQIDSNFNFFPKIVYIYIFKKY